MRLVILGSSSSGNCYILDNGQEALVIEAGMPWRDVQRALDFDISRIVGCIISHEHQDHCREVRHFLQARIPIYCSEGTASALNLERTGLVHTLPENCAIELNRFKVRPFQVEHDAAQPFGFLISHPETGTVLFATDTYYLRYTFRGLNNILLECDYRQDILDANTDEGRIHPAQRERTIKSHMSYETCLETLRANDLSAVHHIVLLHLSYDNANGAEFQEGIRRATTKKVAIAGRGVTIENFNKSPF